MTHMQSAGNYMCVINYSLKFYYKYSVNQLSDGTKPQCLESTGLQENKQSSRSPLLTIPKIMILGIVVSLCTAFPVCLSKQAVQDPSHNLYNNLYRVRC